MSATATESPGYTRSVSALVSPTVFLGLVRETKLRADALRAELAAAEQAHHDAVLNAAQLAGEDGIALLTVSEIAEAAQCSRGRIYKRLGKPTYGDRSTAKDAYR